MKREIAVVGMIVCVAGGLLGGWFIPSPIPGASRVSLLDQLKTRNLVIGTEAYYAPFEFWNITKDPDVIEGFDVDLCNMIAEALNVSITWIDMLFDSLIPACVGGTVDMIAAAMTIDETRSKQLAPSLPYITVGQAVVGRNDSVLVINSLSDLANVYVGVQDGTTLKADLLAAGVDVPYLVTFPDVYGMMIDLVNDVSIDAVYIDEPVYHAWAASYDLKLLLQSGTEPFGLWTRYGEPELLNEINKVILEGFLDGSIYDLYEKWLNITT